MLVKEGNFSTKSHDVFVDSRVDTALAVGTGGKTYRHVHVHVHVHGLLLFVVVVVVVVVVLLLLLLLLPPAQPAILPPLGFATPVA